MRAKSVPPGPSAPPHMCRCTQPRQGHSRRRMSPGGTAAESRSRSGSTSRRGTPAPHLGCCSRIPRGRGRAHSLTAAGRKCRVRKAPEPRLGSCNGSPPDSPNPPWSPGRSTSQWCTPPSTHRRSTLLRDQNGLRHTASAAPSLQRTTPQQGTLPCSLPRPAPAMRRRTRHRTGPRVRRWSRGGTRSPGRRVRCMTPAPAPRPRRIFQHHTPGMMRSSFGPSRYCTVLVDTALRSLTRWTDTRTLPDMVCNQTASWSPRTGCKTQRCRPPAWPSRHRRNSWCDARRHPMAGAQDTAAQSP